MHNDKKACVIRDYSKVMVMIDDLQSEALELNHALGAEKAKKMLILAECVVSALHEHLWTP